MPGYQFAVVIGLDSTGSDGAASVAALATLRDLSQRRPRPEVLAHVLQGEDLRAGRRPSSRRISAAISWLGSALEEHPDARGLLVFCGPTSGGGAETRLLGADDAPGGGAAAHSLTQIERKLARVAPGRFSILVRDVRAGGVEAGAAEPSEWDPSSEGDGFLALDLFNAAGTTSLGSLIITANNFQPPSGSNLVANADNFLWTTNVSWPTSFRVHRRAVNALLSGELGTPSWDVKTPQGSFSANPGSIGGVAPDRQYHIRRGSDGGGVDAAIHGVLRRPANGASLDWFGNSSHLASGFFATSSTQYMLFEHDTTVPAGNVWIRRSQA